VIIWPVVIKHADDAELSYISDQQQWESDTGLHETDYDDADCLIDSSARVFSLTKKQNNIVVPEPRGESISLYDFLGLVKAHAAQKGSCCVAKLYAPTMTEAFKIIESLEDA
jgi:hypothetical protein